MASGYTLKSVQGWLETSRHAHYRIYVGLGGVAAAITIAAVYNTRAYGDSLEISSTELEEKDGKKKVTTKVSTPVQCQSSVQGAVKKSVSWAVINRDATCKAAITDGGEFTATATGTCQVLAVCIANSKLTDTVDVTVQ